MAELKTFAKENQPFFCKDIKEVLKEKDALLKKIQENEAKSKKERAEYISAEEKKHKLALDKIKEEHKAQEDLLRAKVEKQAKKAK